MRISGFPHHSILHPYLFDEVANAALLRVTIQRALVNFSDFKNMLSRHKILVNVTALAIVVNGLVILDRRKITFEGLFHLYSGATGKPDQQYRQKNGSLEKRDF